MNIFEENRFIFENNSGKSHSGFWSKMFSKPDDSNNVSEGLNNLDSFSEQVVPKSKNEEIKDSSKKDLVIISEEVEAKTGSISKKEAIKNKVTEDTDRDLSKLKSEFGPIYGMQQLEIVGSLFGFKSAMEYKFSYEPDRYKEILKGEILEFYKKKGAVWTKLKSLESKSEGVPNESSAMMGIMASAAATSIINKIKAEKEVRQKFYEKWDKKDGVVINIEGTRGTDFKVIFPKDFEEARIAYKTEAEQKAEQEKIANTPEQKKVDKLINSPIGKILAWIGYRNKDGKPDRKKYESIINGTDWFGAFIVGLFGYSEFGGEFYASAKGMLPLSAQNSLASLEKRARNSKYSADAWKKTDNYKEVMGAGYETGKDRKPLTQAEFAVYLGEQKSVDETGVELGADYDLLKLRDKKYKVVLKPGSKIKVPAKGVLQLGGNEYKAGDKEPLSIDLKNKKEFELSGIIPKGTLFANVEFKKADSVKEYA